MADSPSHAPPPSYLQLAAELPRAGLETARLLFSLNRLIREAPRGDGRPVLTIPGYGGGDGSMFFLRYLLDKLGYESYALDLGTNFESAAERIKRIEDAVAFREKMVTQVIQRIEHIHRETQQPVDLIGWSLGGLYAFDVSQSIPDKIRQAITLAAPFGDPRGTSTFNFFRTLNRSTVPIEEQDFALWLNKRELKTDQVPIKVIYSQTDGIVSPQIARLDEHPAVEHIEVDASHASFTVNVKTLEHITHLLQQK
jgi:predicted esterase YcpF (UPF0227 family)